MYGIFSAKLFMEWYYYCSVSILLSLLYSLIKPQMAWPKELGTHSTMSDISTWMRMGTELGLRILELFVGNGGLKAKFFEKAEGLYLEGIRISNKKTEELGDLLTRGLFLLLLSNFSQIWETKTDRANGETKLSLSIETRAPGEAALYLRLP